nr:hypothetical protein [Tanacetum cinerariifolium]
MAQQIILAAQLITKFQGIGRCNNYVVLQTVYLQQLWKIVRKVPETKYTIRFMLDTQEITYTVDMFYDTLQLASVVDKVSAFFTKNLAQPWQTMFKVFNHCLTTRTFGHDQTRINILQLFHVVVIRMNVDYVALLWQDFMNNVFQKKDVI